MFGVNAVVVGVVPEAFYDPVWTGAIRSPADVALALVAFLSLEPWKAPPWLVVVGRDRRGCRLALNPLAGPAPKQNAKQTRKCSE